MTHDEDPLPATQSRDAVHLSNSDGQQARKSATERGTREVDCLPEHDLFRPVEEGKPEGDTRQDTCLCEAEEGSIDEEARLARDDALEGGDDAPSRQKAGKPDGRRHLLDEEVRGHLEDDVGHVEACDGDLVVVVRCCGSEKVGDKAVQAGLPDVGAVKQIHISECRKEEKE